MEDFLIWYKQSGYKQDVIVGNTLTKESVYRLANLKADGFRHLIGPGSMCLTQIKTGIGCPSVTGLYYAWKAVRNFQLANLDYFRHEDPKEENRPSILADGGIRYPKDLVKAIASGADAVICGRIFAGLSDVIEEENIIEKNGKRYFKYRGMASKDVVEDYDLYDGSKKKVEDIIIGDLLMGDDSTPRQVLSLARGREMMYKINDYNKSFVYVFYYYITLKTL